MTDEWVTQQASTSDPNASSADATRAIEQRVMQTKATDAETDSSLRKLLGYGATVLMAAQIAAADVVFVLYASNNGWEIPAATANVWLAAAVVQVVALAHTVARHLFPASRRGPRG